MISSATQFFLLLDVTKNHGGDIVEPIAVTLDKACELTNIGKASMVKLMQDPKFPVFKIGNKAVIPVAGLRKYIETLGAEHHGVV